MLTGTSALVPPSHCMVYSSVQSLLMWPAASQRGVRVPASSLGWSAKETLTNTKYLYSWGSGTNYSQLALKKIQKARSRGFNMEVQRRCLWWCACVHLKNALAHRNLSVTGDFYENDIKRISPLLAFSFNRFSYIVQTVHRSDHLFPHECLFGLDPRPAGLQGDGGCRSSFGYRTFVHI